eukprot:TRINITY_DN30077_c0_g1_i1.p1 TRINITY_DN30077_c0_g1~~TRINITY_DN30077_c0_g1_i1.p1  ORF type:complete len:254 (+),score=40.42 TRINITY_DN30077_c0_g1_i1:678-1439(+)
MALFNNGTLVEAPYYNNVVMPPQFLLEVDGDDHGSRGGPSWLVPLLEGKYFISCQLHSVAKKSERNFFCVDCACDTLCSVCVQKSHAHHCTLQIRRSSYKEAVRMTDLQRLLDLTHIQIYSINGFKIVFLNARPQTNPAKGAVFRCESCQRQLQDKCRFCSLECKLRVIPEDPTISLLPAGMQLQASAPPLAWPPAPSAVAVYDGEYAYGDQTNGLLPDDAMGMEDISPCHKHTPGMMSSDETDDESDNSEEE